MRETIFHGSNRVGECYVSSDLATIAMFVFLVVLAAVVFRFIWLRRVNTDKHLSSDDTQSPTEQRPEWERIVTGDLLP